MKHTVLEAWLSKRGIAFVYEPAIPMEKIQVDAGARKNIRLGAPLSDDIVSNYELALENGAQFPALVLIPVGINYHIINGMHRHAAFQRVKAMQTDAYILKIDDAQTIDMIRRTINEMEGFRPTQEDLIAQALWLVRTQKYTIHDASAMVNVPSAQIQKMLQIERSKAILSEGIGKFTPLELSRMPTTSFVVVHGIRNPDLMRQAFRLAFQARLTTDEIKQLVKDMRDEATDTGQERVLLNYRKDCEARIIGTGGGLTKGPNSPISSFDKYIRKAESVARKVIKDRDSSFSKAEKRSVISACERSIKQLRQIVISLRNTMEPA